MTDETHLRELLFEAIDLVNAAQGSTRQMRKDPDSALTGTAAVWDSLALVQFLIAVEDLLEQSQGRSIPVVDKAEELSAELRTVATLTLYLSERLQRGA